MKMETQQMMELLLARIDTNMKSDQEKAANRKANQNSLARMESQIDSLVSRMMVDRKADHEALKEMMDANQERRKEEMNCGQAEMNSPLSASEEKVEAWIADMKACQEAMEANPVEMTSIMVHEEFHTEDAAARSLGTVRKRHGTACSCRAVQRVKETDPRTLLIMGEVGCHLLEGVPLCKSCMAQ
jgi:hypothetical protein